MAGMRRTIAFLRRWIWNRENLYALIFCLALAAIIILTTDDSPLWIYQGF